MAVAILAAIPASARAQDAPLLSGAPRTIGFSGWSSTLRGDMRTLGMAGAMAGLADSYVGTLDNPAGLAMTMGRAGFQLTTNSISDSALQDATQPVTSSGMMAVIRPYPWGLSLGFSSPHSEGGRYRIAETGNPVDTEVFTREYRIAVSRLFLKNRLSLGGGVILGHAHKSAGQFSTNDLALGGMLGAMYRLPRRWLVGVSFRLPMTYRPDSSSSPGAPIPDFNQPVLVPYQLAAGTSWIPNRFFRVAASVYLTGPRAGAGLLRDEAVSVGEKMTLQPRMGFTYTIAEFAEFEAYLSAGAYLEMSRVEGQGDRFHQTTSLEAYPWIFNVGTGIDVAPGYRNFLISFGVDVAKVMRKMDLLPAPWRPPDAGLLPVPDRFNDDGLPRALVKKWRDPKNPNIIDVGKSLPTKLQNKIESTGESIQKLGEGVVDRVESIPEALGDRIKKAREQQRRKLERGARKSRPKRSTKKPAARNRAQ